MFFLPVESVNFLLPCQLRFRVKSALSYRTHSASDTASLSTRHMAKVVPLPSLIKSEAHQIGKAAILLSLPSVGCTKLNPEIILISSREGHLRKANLSKWKNPRKGIPKEELKLSSTRGYASPESETFSFQHCPLRYKVRSRESTRRGLRPVPVTHPERSVTSSFLLIYFYLFTKSKCFMCEDISGFSSDYFGLYSLNVLGHL